MNVAIFDKTFVGPVKAGAVRIGRTGMAMHPVSFQPNGVGSTIPVFGCRCPCANAAGWNKSHGFTLGHAGNCEGR